MYACEVMVFGGGKLPETLTYFFPRDIPLLARVMVPLRKKNVRGIVIASVPVSQVKSAIKAKDFALKKIKEVVGENIFRPSYIGQALELSSFYGIPAGTLLRALIPVFLFDLPDALSMKTAPTLAVDSPYRSEEGILMLPFAERISYYKTLIRESFARGESVYIATPTTIDADIFASHLEQGIEQYTAVFHSALPKKKLKECFKKITDLSHPILLVGTPSALSLPRHDIRIIVVEKEASTSYVVQGGEPVDTRLLLRAVAKEAHARLIYADTFVRIETYALLKDGSATEVRPPSYRLEEGKTLTIVDMKNESEGGGVVFGTTLTEEVKKTIKKNKKIFLFALRRGFATQIVCQDCGDTIRCPRCDTVLTLVHKNGSPVFWCRTDKKEYDPRITCARCGSWRLIALGVGIERVEEEAKSSFGALAPVYPLGESPSQKEKEKLEKNLEKSGPAVLVGTQRSLGLLPEQATLVGIVSFDTLLYLPHFGASERILSLMSTLWDSTSNTLLVQTREPTHPLLLHLLRGTLFDWYREELALRKKFSFPPYTHILEARIDGNSEKRAVAHERLLRLFGSCDAHPYVRHEAKEDIYVFKIPKSFYDVSTARRSPLAQAILSEKEKGTRIIFNPLTL